MKVELEGEVGGALFTLQPFHAVWNLKIKKNVKDIIKNK